MCKNSNTRAESTAKPTLTRALEMRQNCFMRNNRWNGFCLLLLIVPFGQTVAQSPSLPPNSIVNGASFATATASNGALAPGALVSAFGGNLASITQVSLSVPLSTNLNGSSLTFFAGSSAFAAPLFFVSAGQINAQLPFEVPLNSTITAQVNFNGQTSAAIPVKVVPVSPGIFANAGSGPGAIIHNADFSAITSANPAVPGEYVDIFCTGLGAVSPAAADGAAGPTNPVSLTVASPTVTLAGIAIPPSTDGVNGVVFSALAPGFVGLYQVAFRVPANAPVGTQNVSLTIDGITSNVVTMIVQ
jgi:uncharacterized protein (TIGR03437 family)